MVPLIRITIFGELGADRLRSSDQGTMGVMDPERRINPLPRNQIPCFCLSKV